MEGSSRRACPHGLEGREPSRKGEIQEGESGTKESKREEGDPEVIKGEGEGSKREDCWWWVKGNEERKGEEEKGGCTGVIPRGTSQEGVASIKF